MWLCPEVRLYKFGKIFYNLLNVFSKKFVWIKFILFEIYDKPILEFFVKESRTCTHNVKQKILKDGPKESPPI